MFSPVADDSDFFVPIRDGSDAATIQRLVSAPSRYSFYVDVGVSDPQKVDRILRSFKVRFLLARLKRIFEGPDDAAPVPAR